MLNPKAVSLGELYGEFDLNTNEWTDGILSSVMRVTCSGKRDTVPGVTAVTQYRLNTIRSHDDGVSVMLAVARLRWTSWLVSHGGTKSEIFADTN